MKRVTAVLICSVVVGGLSACSSSSTPTTPASSAPMSSPTVSAPNPDDLSGRVQAFCDQADEVASQYKKLKGAGSSVDPAAAQAFNEAAQALMTSAQELGPEASSDPKLSKQLMACADRAANAVQ